MQRQRGRRPREDADADVGRMDGRMPRPATRRRARRVKTKRLTDVFMIIADVDNKKKVSTFVIDCAKPVRIPMM